MFCIKSGQPVVYQLFRNICILNLDIIEIKNSNSLVHLSASWSKKKISVSVEYLSFSVSLELFVIFSGKKEVAITQFLFWTEEKK
jgi:hypothetical protein